MVSDNILMLSIAVAGIVKSLVDIIRLMFPDPPQWVSPIAALILGIGCVLLWQVADGITLSPANAAQGILAGLLAGTSAVGITTLSRKAS